MGRFLAAFALLWALSSSGDSVSCLAASPSDPVPQSLEAYPLPAQAVQSLTELAAKADILVLGETHGTQEVPQVASALLAPLSKQGYGVLALEIPTDQEQPLSAWAAGQTTSIPSFFKKGMDLEDGRGNVQLLALIRTALAPPFEWKLICFDQAASTGPYSPEDLKDPFVLARRRDAEMARVLGQQRGKVPPDAKVLAICGNLHARTANQAPPDDLLSKLWPSFAAHLQREHEAWRLSSINVVPHGGTYFAMLDGGDAAAAPRGGIHPIRSPRKLAEAELRPVENANWNWELNLPRATAATFLTFIPEDAKPDRPGK